MDGKPMSKFDWKSIVGTAAPALATALGGPLAGVAVKTIATHLLGKPDAKEEEVEAAIIGADPQTLLKLKEIDADFKKAMTAAGIRLEEIASEDRASARARQVGLKDSTPAILAYAVTLGFFGVLGFMLVNGKPATGGDALLVMLGSLGTAWAAITSYFFGSSSSSRQKDETLAHIAKMP
jgi:hypothetical protein